MQEAYVRDGLCTKRVKGKGWGVFTRAFIPKDELVGIEAGGRIVSETEVRKLRKTIGDYSQNVYAGFHWAPKGKKDIGILCRLNHSCDPNVGVLGDMSLVALRDIAPREELQLDYGTYEFDSLYNEFRCRCGAAQCRGVITGNDWQQEDLWKRFFPDHFASYLQKQIRGTLIANHLALQDGTLFFVDKDDPETPHLHELKSSLAHTRSPYQHIQIFDTVRFGKMLVLDGSPQISLADGHIYTELLAAVPLLCHDNPHSVCILGGGDGAVAALVLKDPRVRGACLVDIDAMVVDLTQQYMPELWNGADQNPKLKIKIGDAIEFLEDTSAMFDVIIVDLTDPNERSQSARLVSSDFFNLIGVHLKKDGVVSINAGQLVPDRLDGHQLFRNLIFEHTLQRNGTMYSLAEYIPSFSLPWSFVLGTRVCGNSRSIFRGDREAFLRIRQSPFKRLQYLSTITLLRALTASLY